MYAPRAVLPAQIESRLESGELIIKGTVVCNYLGADSSRTPSLMIPGTCLNALPRQKVNYYLAATLGTGTHCQLPVESLLGQGVGGTCESSEFKVNHSKGI